MPGSAGRRIEDGQMVPGYDQVSARGIAERPDLTVVLESLQQARVVGDVRVGLGAFEQNVSDPLARERFELGGPLFGLLRIDRDAKLERVPVQAIDAEQSTRRRGA